MNASSLRAIIAPISAALCLALAHPAQAWELAFQTQKGEDSTKPILMDLGTARSVFPTMLTDSKDEIRADRLKPAAKVQTKLGWWKGSNPLSPYTLPALVLSNPAPNTIRVTLGRCKFESALSATEATNTVIADIPSNKEVVLTFAGTEAFRLRGVDGKPVKWSCSAFSVQNL